MSIKTVYDLDPQDFYEAGLVFKRLNCADPKPRVKMTTMKHDAPNCIACMASWYSVGKGETGSHYTVGAMQLAEDLGFKSSEPFYCPIEALKMFFNNNADLWGNDRAYQMFSARQAFGVSAKEILTCGVIGDFLIAVGDRIKAKQTRVGRIFWRIKRCLRRL